MKVLVVVSALLGVSAAFGVGNPLACLNGPCAAPYAAPNAAGLSYATPYAGIAAPYAGWAMPYAGIAAPYAGWARPFAGIARPLAYAAPAAASSQFQAQDELGQYKYGYVGPLSSKVESKNALGGTTGSYSYLDAHGLKQTVSYVADAAGFHVKATNLPVAPVAILQQPVNTQVAPAPVSDTADVKAAKAEFQKLYNEAAAAAEAAPDARRRRSLSGPNDTPEVVAAKALHAQLYNAAKLRAAGVPVPMPVQFDTPAVRLEKARHAMLYNQAAARAALNPDYTSPYNMYGLGYRYGYSGAPGMIF